MIAGQTVHLQRLEPLGFGQVITSNTLQKMKRIVNDSIRNYYVRRWAEKMVENTPEDGSDTTRVHAIYDYLATYTRYLKDPWGLELLKTPLVSLQLLDIGETPSLDCDDLTILAMSLLKSIGFRVGFRATSYRPDKKFSHVYGLVKIKGIGWVPFDLVKKPGVGFEPPAPTNIYDMEV